MINYESMESLLDSFEAGEFAEAPFRRPPVRTPTGRPSYEPRPAPNAASQGQVQAAARNLDSKIETLSNAVKALEARTNTLGSEQERVGAVVRKEIEERKKTADGIRGELQQTKTLSVLLPFLTQSSTEISDGTRTATVLTKPTSGIASFLPFLLLMSGPTTEGSKGMLGGDNTMMLLLLVMLSDRK